ncbi:MAG: helix-turn-helix domain-containing protein [Leptolyngbyaceae cyanobacterium]
MSNTNYTQAEQLKRIGEQLQQARELQGVTLDQVALKTYIPLRLLQAIEDGDLARLPEPIFVQGFIRRYADVLSLDGIDISRQFPVDVPLSPVVDSLIETEPSAPPPLADSTPIPEPPSQPEVIPDQKFGKVFRQFWPSMIAGGLALLVLAAAIAGLRRSQPSPSVSPPVSPTGAPSPFANRSPKPTSSPSPTADLQVSPSPTVSPTAAATASPDKPVQVALKTTDRAWVEVIVDGKTVFSGILQKGEQKAWTATQSLTVVSGNAGAVQLSHNNGSARAMGKPGEIKEARFNAATPGGIQTN